MSGPDQVNLSINKKEVVNSNYRYNPNMKNSVPSGEFQGIQQYKDTSSDMSKMNQIDGDLLSPFILKKNNVLFETFDGKNNTKIEDTYESLAHYTMVE